MYQNATLKEIDETMAKAWSAFEYYKTVSLGQRAALMREVASQLGNHEDQLITAAMKETNLPDARLRTELKRTMFQLTSYADACEKGDWLEARIDTATPVRNPPKPDVRKTLVPLGPVVVFGSSNFPFAYSTAGGDTACALAAGCSVIVKAHPAHAETSTITAEAIKKAIKKTGIQEAVFSHVYGSSFEVGEALAKHPLTKAIGFTGSFTGGKQLFDWANQRKEPIPVFAEMGSVNPVFLLPEKLRSSANEIAVLYAASITLGSGQFCTNPGLIVGVDGEHLQKFKSLLGAEIKKVAPVKMLHPGIAKSYAEKREKALSQQDVELLAESALPAIEMSGSPTIAATTATSLLNNPLLQQEVFGPFSLIIACADIHEMKEVARQLDGQLTCSLMAEQNEIKDYEDLLQIMKSKCGRIIFNGVPTGVEVCLSMQHGGPFPATTDSRFTSVGADGIKRFARPLAYQNWPDAWLPAELKNDNPLNIFRTVNDQLTREKI